MTSDAIRLSGTALVTGGGRGLGREFAIALARAGMRVAISARSADQLEETAGVIRGGGGTAHTIVADVSDAAGVSRMVEEAERTLGPLDLLVNNAGMGGPLGPTWETDPAEWWRCFEVNMLGPYLCCRAALPGMIGRNRGRIINIASGAGTIAIPYMNSYATAKAALIRFTETLAAEAAPHGITAFSIQPGTVRTALGEELRQSEAGRKWLPWLVDIFDNNPDPPDHGVRLVLYLASGKADGLSGRFFMVPEDPEEMVARADEIREKNMYILRLRRMKR